MSNPSGVTHCVMRRGASWFAFPAEKVREVLFRPPLLAVPHSDGLLAGLCHVRSEFFPVLRLDRLVVDDPASLPSERQMLVLHGDEGPWGVLVDQVTALASLETSAAPEEDFQENWSEVVSGWAAHETQVVRVLDPQRFYSLADHLLCESWAKGSPLPDAVEQGADNGSAGSAPALAAAAPKSGPVGHTLDSQPAPSNEIALAQAPNAPADNDKRPMTHESPQPSPNPVKPSSPSDQGAKKETQPPAPVP